MKKQIKTKLANLKFEKIWPFAIIITGLLLSASITFASFSLVTKREVIVEEPVETKDVLGLEANTYSTPAPIPSPIPYPSILKITPSSKSTIKPTPIATSSPLASPQQSNPTPSTVPIIIQVIATPTPSPSPSPSPEPLPSLEPSPSPVTQAIAIEIKQPDTQLNFELGITEGINVCQAMKKAKDEGKINSLTISDKYLASFNTLLVEEINGYKNNWVFTVNGESPMGCSLVTLKNGDKVDWKFLIL